MTTATCATNRASDEHHEPPHRRIVRSRWWGVYLFLLSLLVAVPTPLLAASNINADILRERSDAAARMVLGIISYSRWPVAPPVIRLCVISPTDYAEMLFNPALMETTHPVQTQRYSLPNNSLNSKCDVVYLGHIELQQRQQLSIQLNGTPILTISEDYNECTFGSVFCLLLNDKQVSFKVNMDALARGGVRIHPSVLQLARKKANAR